MECPDGVTTVFLKEVAFVNLNIPDAVGGMTSPDFVSGHI